MVGVIWFWRVDSAQRELHDRLMQGILRLEREHCPEVLLCLGFGPDADGNCSEVQVYQSAQTEADFPARVARDVPELQRLWEQLATITQENSLRSVRFENPNLLSESFARSEAGLAQVAPNGVIG